MGTTCLSPVLELALAGPKTGPVSLSIVHNLLDILKYLIMNIVNKSG